MIRTFKNLSRGGYVADFRHDEGIRIREDFISPCLTASLKHSKDDLTNCILLIEINENKRSNEEKIHYSE